MFQQREWYNADYVIHSYASGDQYEQGKGFPLFARLFAGV